MSEQNNITTTRHGYLVPLTHENNDTTGALDLDGVVHQAEDDGDFQFGAALAAGVQYGLPIAAALLKDQQVSSATYVNAFTSIVGALGDATKADAQRPGHKPQIKVKSNGAEFKADVGCILDVVGSIFKLIF